LVWGTPAQAPQLTDKNKSEDSSLADRSGWSEDEVNVDDLRNNFKSWSKDSADLLIIKDQPAGATVKADKVKIVDQAKWVVVRADDQGHWGNILGASFLFPGEHREVELYLLAPNQNQQRYHVYLTTDDGDKIFDYQTDTPILGQDGLPIGVSFSTGVASTSQSAI